MLRSNRFALLTAAAVFALGTGLTACASSGATATSSSLTGGASRTAYASDSAASAVTATAAKASGAALKLASVAVTSAGSTKHQRVLVTASGRAVYLLTGDSKTHPECTSTSCLKIWPAVTSKAAKPKLGAGIRGKLTVWKHDGIGELVLNGHPLYTYIGDSRSDVATGQAVQSFGGTWWLMSSAGQLSRANVAGASATSASAATNTTSSAL